MNTLVVYYSRSGVTKKVALALAEKLDATVEELVDTKSRSGPIGFARAGIDAARKTLVPIGPTAQKPADFDLVLIGTPVWANTMSSAVRTYLTENGQAIGRAGVFCTTHSSGIEQTLDQMGEMIAGAAIARMGLRQKAVKRDEFADDLKTFLDAVRKDA